ncbi:MAG: butyrate kinase [Negativicutes bacterium]|nr:butyrate kinase [Negativicutes bacterium]
MQTILVLNPGSTSTKVALFQDKNKQYECNLQHAAAVLKQFPQINDQIELRKAAILAYLQEIGFNTKTLTAIAARGGVIGQLESGAYRIDAALVRASRLSPAPHASNLAPIIAYELAEQWQRPAYIYDPVCGCGIPEPLYTISGIKELPRLFLSHVLNSRAVCFEYADRAGLDILRSSFIVTHLGGGITSNLIRNGKILDLVADDEGSFSPERSGGVPCRALVKLCYSGRYTESEMQTLLKGKGGLVDYLGSNDFIEVEKRAYAEGDEQALLLIQALALQVAKGIGSLATVVNGAVDAILLTGGLAHSDRLCSLITQRIRFLAPVAVLAGSREMEALAFGVLRVLNGEEAAHTFPGK